MNHHVNGATCSLCSEKIETLDEALKPIAVAMKAQFPDCHISWGFRDQANQDAFFHSGATKAIWPHSAHNVMKDGHPSAQAYDIFQLGSDGVARFKIAYCYQVWAWIQGEFPSRIAWAGLWEHFKEFDHYQLASYRNPSS